MAKLVSFLDYLVLYIIDNEAPNNNEQFTLSEVSVTSFSVIHRMEIEKGI